MIVEHHFSLKKFNTFGLEAKASHFVEVASEDELKSFILESPYRSQLALLLGGGSNLLLTRDIQGTVLHIAIKGKAIVEETEDYAIIEAGAGENWHGVVLWALDKNLGGIENLSLIPGNIGTAPVQNIGAYGVEIKEVFHSLDALHVHSGEKRTFSLSECAFGYRDSIFKQSAKGEYIITRVRLRLQKPPHKLDTHYGAIATELERMNIINPGIRDVSNAVIAIRKSKLPDPAVLGNSGSFFKNPIVENIVADNLKKTHPEAPVYPVNNHQSKLAAGWLIEKAGWKGFRRGDAGVHERQALVLVNYGNSTGTEILTLAYNIIADIEKKFNVVLEPEVNII